MLTNEYTKEVQIETGMDHWLVRHAIGMVSSAYMQSSRSCNAVLLY